MNALRNSLREITRYPSAIVGVFVILLLFVQAAYAMITIPYDEAIRLWRGGEEVWYQNPKFAPPEWTNVFSAKKEPISFHAKSVDGALNKVVTPGDKVSTQKFSYSFDYNYDGFPQEMLIYFNTAFDKKQPFVSIYLQTPDGRKLRVADVGVPHTLTFRFSQDKSCRND